MNFNINFNMSSMPMFGNMGIGNMMGLDNMMGLGSMMSSIPSMLPMDSFAGSVESFNFMNPAQFASMFNGSNAIGMPDMGFGFMPGMQGLFGMQQGGMFGNQVNSFQMLQMMQMMMQMMQMMQMMMMQQMMQQNGSMGMGMPMPMGMPNMGMQGLPSVGGGFGGALPVGGGFGGALPVGGGAYPAVGANGIPSGGASGSEVVEYAKRFLGINARDLKGVMPHFQDAGNARKDCADFVSSVLQNTGKLQGHYNSVVGLEAALKQQGWVEVPQSMAQPGDVYLYTGPNGNHTEIVSEPGARKLIGSNNRNNDGTQVVSYGKVSQSKRPRFYHKP